MRAIARFVVTAGGEGLFFLRPGRYLVGRNLDCDLILSSPGVSRRHAVVEVDEAAATVVDQGSRHGTRVDGKPADSARIEHGTIVEFGPVECRFERFPPADLDPPTPSGTGPRSADPDLTQAERRVLVFLLSGLSEKAIATRLTISPHTVHNHVRSIYAAHRVNSRPELLALFISRPEPL